MLQEDSKRLIEKIQLNLNELKTIIKEIVIEEIEKKFSK